VRDSILLLLRIFTKEEGDSVEFSDEESGAVATQPTKKRTGAERPAVGKKLSKSMKPASPPKAKKTAIKYDDESDDIMDYDDLPKGPPRSRVARGAAQKYVDVLSSDEDEDADEGSMFVDE
jgi:DNA topoisomerase II